MSVAVLRLRFLGIDNAKQYLATHPFIAISDEVAR